jgi:hypothetical protein
MRASARLFSLSLKQNKKNKKEGKMEIVEKILAQFLRFVKQQIIQVPYFLVVDKISYGKCWCCEEPASYQCVKIGPSFEGHISSNDIYFFCEECIYEYPIVQRDLLKQNETLLSFGSIKWDEHIAGPYFSVLPHFCPSRDYVYKIKWRDDYVIDEFYLYCRKCENWVAYRQNIIDQGNFEKDLIIPLVLEHKQHCSSR